MRGGKPVDTMTAETAVEGYVVLDELPRPDGKLTKEQLDPFVAAARAGDPDAVQALLRLIKPTVVRYCRARIGGGDPSFLSAARAPPGGGPAGLEGGAGHPDRRGAVLFLVGGGGADKVARPLRPVARRRPA